MIQLKSKDEIEKIKQASRIVADLLKALSNFAKAGCKTKELDLKAREILKNEGAESAFLGYRGYPAAICVSINEEIIHGIPGDRRIKEGDIVGLDVGAKYKGYYSDAATTVAIGKIPGRLQKLLETGQQALDAAITEAVVGNRVHDISHAIQSHVEKNGYSVVRDYVGHGVGNSLHEEPSIPNFGQKGTGPRIKAGMVFAIEVMINSGSWQVGLLDDGWTAVTSDGKPSAHFEHTVAVTEAGPEVLTKI